MFIRVFKSLFKRNLMSNTVKKKGADRFVTNGPEEFINKTAKGALKSFDEPMAKSYHPPAVEASWNDYWEAKGYYKPDNNSDAEPYVMVLPPPNVTGTLHLGHALTVAIQDAIMRWNRMKGKNVLWLPGVDHAGIATQVVVEKKLMREQGKTRHDVGREDFLKLVWQWKEENANRIVDQLKKMGVSLDWSRNRFTMDPMLSNAVNEAFVRMYENNKIFRANRLVNWSCTLNSAISSIEVEHKEVTGSTLVNVPGYEKKVEIGVIHDFAYQVKDKFDENGLPRELIVATTRIETMLGDVAVAVHPDDDRYKDLIGCELIHPFIKDRKMIIIADDILVDMNFGTGAVKVTPAHDPNDFECGKRNNLPQISILDDAGNINENGGEYNGMPRFLVRELIINKLTTLGLYKGKKDNAMSVGFVLDQKILLNQD